ncbi:hypothetical protein N7466_002710 [Penicillium verhagenii]|uniref:uncharacterized protein n=1 Tax=Penicillium verhagenii TaxID=1562060 RepID=UPI0025457146|nr:uncharacterized protein N7466_002710 [Penicillium verhagenii]KAJ5939576.1 hypothetical protein N7466_002710 [Penicillium verhagenii]
MFGRTLGAPIEWEGWMWVGLIQEERVVSGEGSEGCPFGVFDGDPVRGLRGSQVTIDMDLKSGLVWGAVDLGDRIYGDTE